MWTFSPGSLGEVILAAVVCPHPPALLRELGGLADPLVELRESCAAALKSGLAEDPDTVVVVGEAPAPGSWSPSAPIGVRRFGATDAREAGSLPQSLGVGRRLLDEAGWDGPLRLYAASAEADSAEVTDLARTVAGIPGRVLLVVMADGSARRGERAPGHLDERAFDFDDEIGSALAHGDADRLVGLDADLAGELLVQGRAALAVLGAVAGRVGGGPESAQVSYRDDPFGVLYTVASWHFPH